MHQRTIPESTRANIALTLAQHYAELAGNEPRESRRFNAGRALLAQASERGLQDDYEKEICSAAAMISGRRHDPHRVLYPFSAFARDLTVASSAAGGYLVGGDKRPPIDVMRSWSATARAGVTLVSGLIGNPSIPQVSAAAAASWGATEAASITHDQPDLGESVMTPKRAAGVTRFSRQLMKQASALDAFIEAQLLEAVGALLDQAILAGTGVDGQPLGIINTSGVGTQSGAALSHAGTRAMRKQVLDAGGLEERIAWVGATDVQETLGGRERFSGGGRAIWDDNGMLGRPAHATGYAPAGALIGGDWSRCMVGLWGPGFIVETNPYENFQSGQLSARIILECDVVLTPRAAFTVATSVS